MRDCGCGVDPLVFGHTGTACLLRAEPASPAAGLCPPGCAPQHTLPSQQPGRPA